MKVSLYLILISVGLIPFVLSSCASGEVSETAEDEYVCGDSSIALEEPLESQLEENIQVVDRLPIPTSKSDVTNKFDSSHTTYGKLLTYLEDNCKKEHIIYTSYPFNKGFVVMLALEQLDKEGRYLSNNRFVKQPVRLESNGNIISRLLNLFKFGEAQHRMICFVISDDRIIHSKDTFDEVVINKVWQESMKSDISKAIKRRPRTENTKIMAYVYEYVRSIDEGKLEQIKSDNRRFSPELHLDNAKIFR